MVLPSSAIKSFPLLLPAVQHGMLQSRNPRLFFRLDNELHSNGLTRCQSNKKALGHSGNKRRTGCKRVSSSMYLYRCFHHVTIDHIECRIRIQHGAGTV